MALVSKFVSGEHQKKFGGSATSKMAIFHFKVSNLFKNKF